MTTNLKTHEDNPFYMTRFYGGDDRGTCVQITDAGEYASEYANEHANEHANEYAYLQMNRNQAKALIRDLEDFILGYEKEDE